MEVKWKEQMGEVSEPELVDLGDRMGKDSRRKESRITRGLQFA